MPSGSQATLSLLVRSLLGEGRFVDYGVLTAVGLYYVLPILLLFLIAQEQLDADLRRRREGVGAMDVRLEKLTRLRPGHGGRRPGPGDPERRAGGAARAVRLRQDDDVADDGRIYR